MKCIFRTKKPTAYLCKFELLNQNYSFMETSLHELDKIQSEINSEKNKYKEAIKNNQKFDDVKVIYRKIKTLEKEANELIKRDK